MGSHRVGVVIPALNEAATIQTVVNMVLLYGLPIVVDDGSIDQTANLAIEAGAKVIVHKKNLGYDAALNTGFESAASLGVEIIITLDADGQHDPSMINEFIKKIDDGYDLVIGQRNHKQRFAEVVFALYTKLRFGLNDPLCGMKAYKLNVYKSLGYFDSYRSIGTELAMFAIQNKYCFTQVKISVKKRIGTSRFGKVVIGNYKIVRAMVIFIFRF